MTTPNLIELSDPLHDTTLLEPRAEGVSLTLAGLVGIALPTFLLVENVWDHKFAAAMLIIVGLLGFLIGLRKLLGTQDSLRLHRTGFEIHHCGRIWRTSWDQVDHFAVVQIGTLRHYYSAVGMAMVPSARNAGMKIANALSGCDGTFTSTYGLKPNVFAMVMNARLDGTRQL